MKSILLWLFVINLGIALGAGLYEARVVIPQWVNLSPKDWPNTGLLFWAYVTTVPLTLLTLSNLIAAWLDKGGRRKWWLGALFIIRIERITTFSYFIPAMQFGFAPCGDCCKVIAMASFQSCTSSSYPRRLFDGAQGIVATGDRRG